MDISIGHSLWLAIDSLQAKTNQYHVQAAKDKILCRLIFLPLNDKTPDILDAGGKREMHRFLVLLMALPR